MKIQSLEAKKGEVEFRQKLVRQQTQGEDHINDEFDREAIERILSNRMAKTLRQMMSIKERGIVVSPYIEIGAERCQRSLIMENDIGAEGIAVDISLDMLKSCSYYGKVFDKSEIPMRICCDANYLPIASNSIPFVFCYETLHHFPDPTPIIKEIHRVLQPGGHFFFDEEPYKMIAHLNVYKTQKAFSKEALERSKLKKRVDKYLARKDCNEIEFGVIENDEIPLSTWKMALSLFEDREVRLHTIRNIESHLYSPTSRLKSVVAYLFGGTISGLLSKAGVFNNIKTPLQDIFICPSCMVTNRESSLRLKDRTYFCDKCEEEFPAVNGIPIMLPIENLRVLYPEEYKKGTQK